WWGTHQLSGYVIEVVGLATAAVLIWKAIARPAGAALLVPVSLFATAALPFVAFYQGHPYRVRYMIPVVAACALFGGLAVGLVGLATRLRSPEASYGEATPKLANDPRGKRRREAGSYVRITLAVLLIGSTLVESPPWDTDTPLMEEARRDEPLSRERRVVTACLAAYRGEKVLASMGSLAHYMQELSREGFGIADFVHEGNGSIWQLALETGPAPHVGWMLVEEKAEDGDVLARHISRDASFARGMTRVCEGGGVALYQRQPIDNRR
ncbi:MAG: hypothetical protein ACRD2A_15400, partial [Vicinamibacterales bacterium]